MNREFIYLLRLREYVKNNENVYKIGRSKTTIEIRMNGYPKNSELICLQPVTDSTLAEGKLKKLFKYKFIHRPDIGQEYFEGDGIEMVITINNYINKEYKTEKSNLKILMKNVINGTHIKSIDIKTGTFNSFDSDILARCIYYIIKGLDLNVKDINIYAFVMNSIADIQNNSEHYIISGDINVLKLYKLFVKINNNERMIKFIYKNIEHSPIKDIDVLLKDKNLLEIYISYLKNEISLNSLQEIMKINTSIDDCLTPSDELAASNTEIVIGINLNDTYVKSIGDVDKSIGSENKRSINDSTINKTESTTNKINKSFIQNKSVQQSSQVLNSNIYTNNIQLDNSDYNTYQCNNQIPINHNLNPIYSNSYNYIPPNTFDSTLTHPYTNIHQNYLHNLSNYSHNSQAYNIPNIYYQQPYQYPYNYQHGYHPYNDQTDENQSNTYPGNTNYQY